MPTVGLVGVGLIGRAWANVFSRGGWDVRIWDPEPAALAAAPGLIAQSLADVARHGLAKDPASAAKRVRTAASLEETARDVELVIESGPERVEVKVDLFARLDAVAPADTILASSSSAIVASRFTEKLKGRNRCLVAHPVNPPHVVPIVELSGSPWTSPDTIARARAILRGRGPGADRSEEGDRRVHPQPHAGSVALGGTAAGGRGLRLRRGPRQDHPRRARPALVVHGAVRDHRAQCAPGGIPDYCARFGETMYGLASRPVTAEVWGKENVGRAVASWGRVPTPQHILDKQRWRDDRLAALVAHKKSQPQLK